jgi:hypothetical protein
MVSAAAVPELQGNRVGAAPPRRLECSQPTIGIVAQTYELRIFESNHAWQVNVRNCSRLTPELYRRFRSRLAAVDYAMDVARRAVADGGEALVVLDDDGRSVVLWSGRGGL